MIVYYLSFNGRGFRSSAEHYDTQAKYQSFVEDGGVLSVWMVPGLPIED